ncbi:mitochondrial F1F0-ATP synthase-like protein g subunit [Sporormia fimetaria CBS 119925]|uniref:Mitochondrial F1F0-ATP synthase-like protein g subunit n=1 Tax=Sporormia fimetaria CBS 119925 TaxID=1340428 RepID=A0A6A6VKZ6_9PLEO|nr:mitochondrial F1F0-ATP synthase-like protein g subunit [Sporormia fimetaria CBS 119925]
MSFAASRAVLRRTTFAVRRAGIRNASSTSDATAAAKEKAAQAQSKASEGLTKVSSSAGSALSKAGSMASGAMNTLANAGGRTGRLVGRIQSMIPVGIYYSKVALEVSKYVIRERKMSPPDVATFQKYFQNMFNQLRAGKLFQQAESASAQPTSLLQRVRNLSTAQWASAGVVVAEVIGMFSLGEMIGRRKVVGYHMYGEEAHH